MASLLTLVREGEELSSDVVYRAMYDSQEYCCYFAVKDEDCSGFHYLVRPSLSNIEGKFFYGHLALANSEEEACRKLYAKAWIDCYSANADFLDLTENAEEIPRSPESFARLLLRFGGLNLGMRSMVADCFRDAA